jgi:hypothetical protein
MLTFYVFIILTWNFVYLKTKKKYSFLKIYIFKTVGSGKFILRNLLYHIYISGTLRTLRFENKSVTSEKSHFLAEEAKSGPILDRMPL